MIHEEEKASSSSSDESADECKAHEKISCNSGQHSSRQRPRVPGLQRDIEILKAELLTFIANHGQNGFMPMRKQLRLHGRVDIEKAITRMGGFRKIASLMNLSLAYKHRKPKGYWDNLENMEEEVNFFSSIFVRIASIIKFTPLISKWWPSGNKLHLRPIGPDFESS